MNQAKQEKYVIEKSTKKGVPEPPHLLMRYINEILPDTTRVEWCRYIIKYIRDF